MIVYFRLLAGLISLESILCFDHFWSSGPAGTFESRMNDMTWAGEGLFSKAEEQDRERDRDEAEPDQQGVAFRDDGNHRAGLFRAKAEGLKH